MKMKNKTKDYLEDLTPENTLDKARELIKNLYENEKLLKWKDAAYARKLTELIEKKEYVTEARNVAKNTQEYLDYKDQGIKVNYLKRQYYLIKAVLNN